MKKISIVITTFNRLTLLKRTVESALNQSKSCEIVVVDDCSNDGSQIYLESLGERIVYHRNQNRCGQAISVNTGVNLAKGDWIKLIADDDYFHPECIQKFSQIINEYQDIVICSCQAVYVDKDERYIKTTRKFSTQTGVYLKQSDIHYGMLLDIIHFGVPAQVCFEKNAFIKAGGFNPKLDNFIDIDAWIIISKFGDAILINEALVYYTRWQGSFYKISVLKRWETNITIKKKIYNLVTDKYTKFLPSFELITDYLSFYWGLIALKRLKLIIALKLIRFYWLNYHVIRIFIDRYLLLKYTENNQIFQDINFDKKTTDILNISVNNMTTNQLLKNLKTEGGIVFTINVDHLMKLQKNHQFYQVYQRGDYIVCDSQILIWISHFLGNPLLEKISGSDFFPIFYSYNKDHESIKIYLIGSTEYITKNASENINKKVGRKIIVGGFSPSWNFQNEQQECLDIVNDINKSSATVLAIGVGAPKQEEWIFKYKHLLKKINIYLAIGAAIDFESGVKKRAPKWVSNIGLEWFYRLLQEPRRLWKRYLINDLPFFGLILQQKFNLYRNPFSNINEEVKNAANESDYFVDN